mgnify:FL=1
MGLIAQKPWTELSHIFKDAVAIDPTGNKAGLTEHNWYCNKIPDSANVDPVGTTTFNVSTELIMNPARSEYFGNGASYRNKDARIEADWDDGDLNINELQYEPQKTNSTKYDVDFGFTVSVTGPEASVGIDVEAPKLKHKEYSDQPDKNVRTNWDFQGLFECDKARCSRVTIGNSGVADADEPSSSLVNICPTLTESKYQNLNGEVSSTFKYFNPRLL